MNHPPFPIREITLPVLEAARQNLFSALVGDAMDNLGLGAPFLPPQIKPVDDQMVVVGWAMPVTEIDVDADSSTGAPFGLMFDALDDLKPGEIYFASGASPNYALWGGLMSTRAIHLGAAGAVLNGYSRDTSEIRSLSFPTFSYGGYAQDQAGRGTVVDYRTSISVGDLTVVPGDLVFGDLDGVCVIPQDAAIDVFNAAFEKLAAEDLVRQHIIAGGTSKEAFKKYGIM
ncbi:MAG: RraA family protein [Acidimicrobiia bacterium]|nr:MAG: RraA family protein [Acidimicrobiia bacterium]